MCDAHVDENDFQTDMMEDRDEDGDEWGGYCARKRSLAIQQSYIDECAVLSDALRREEDEYEYLEKPRAGEESEAEDCEAVVELMMEAK